MPWPSWLSTQTCIFFYPEQKRKFCTDLARLPRLVHRAVDSCLGQSWSPNTWETEA